jgi:hypothetical protein
MKRVATIPFDGERARLRESYENLSVHHAQAMRLLRRVLSEVTEDQEGDWVYTYIVTDILEDIKAFLDNQP